MFAAANQTHFSLHIDGLTHDFQVLAFDGTEADPAKSLSSEVLA